MNWRTEWTALSARIQGVADAARFYLETIAIGRFDNYNVLSRRLMPETLEIYKQLSSFQSAQSRWLPPGATQCLDRFLKVGADIFQDSKMDEHGAIQFRVTSLITVRSEFEYHIADFTAFARRQSERAFAHIQRSIVADEDERDKWSLAFDSGELACERLGSVRLLAHGIWAFKINAVGGRTDLIFHDALKNGHEIERVADALVLTEWKVCPAQGEVSRKLAEAKEQTKKYCTGILSGIELSNHRYLVMISKDSLTLPDDEIEADIVFRHINIATKPSSPSVGARIMRGAAPT